MHALETAHLEKALNKAGFRNVILHNGNLIGDHLFGVYFVQIGLFLDLLLHERYLEETLLSESEDLEEVVAVLELTHRASVVGGDSGGGD